MAKLWTSPIYKLRSEAGKEVLIDVTSSVSPGIQPNSRVSDVVAPVLKDFGVQSILDFGAGALRHTVPLLSLGFDVYAVEFEACYTRPAVAAGLQEARKYPNFTSLIWPHDFAEDAATFDAILLCYVLQTMPVPSERTKVLSALKKKAKRNSYLLYMSRFGQLPANISRTQRVSDGYYMWPKREFHSFYREFSTQETHEMMKAHSFRYIKPLSQRGTDQVFLYGKGDASWI